TACLYIGPNDLEPLRLFVVGEQKMLVDELGGGFGIGNSHGVVYMLIFRRGFEVVRMSEIKDIIQQSHQR
ncbi:MAG: hypothetical protein AAFS10_02940, partial [Myxococcota bacterium]